MIAVAGLVAYSPRAEANGPVFAGDDLLYTPDGMAYDNQPIPADFFNPGSDPFTGGIPLKGAPLNNDEGGFGTFPFDTVVRRGATSAGFTCGSTETVPIEIVSLQLVGSSPITVTYNGGMNSELWDVDVCLDSSPQPQGQMTINHECREGGTYTAVLPVRALLTFTRQTNPVLRQIVHRVDLSAFGWWSHNNLFGLLTVLPGTTIDRNCNGVLEATPPDLSSIGSSNFFPGLWSTDCEFCDVPGNFGKPMTPEQARWAAHGIYVANPDKPIFVPTQPCQVPGPTGPTCLDADQTVCELRGGGPITGATCVLTEDCFDGADNDGDGCVDGADADCGATEPDCADGTDDDCDGCVDGVDSDCGGGETSCTDGVDNDCDTCVDDLDSDCGAAETSCADRLDNDCDGLADCDDPDCLTSPDCKCAPAGRDCFTTVCGGGTQYDFGTSPIPNGFFDDGVVPDGSDPFTGVVKLGGLGAFPGDTIVQRLGDMCFDDANLPDTQTIPIQLVQLGLQSCNPITVTYNGGGNPEQWNVFVGLPGPQPQGTMSATKTHADGGTYSATLPVDAEFTFVRVSDGFTPLPGPLAAPSVVLNTVCDSTWLQDCPNCERGCGSTGFYPGWDGAPSSPCCEETCHAGPAPGHEHCTVPPDCQPCTPDPTEDCTDGLDNDGDGLCDCKDPDCAAVCCGDGICDASIGEDQCTCPTDCGTPPANETGLCTDGIDNDCDMRIDCDDPDCANDPACDACGDGACDPAAGEDQCTCPTDCGTPPANETGLCTDGVDNDCDNSIDCNDPDCANDPACDACGDGACDPAAGEDQCTCPQDCGTPPSTEAGLCTDGVDNDCDGAVDCSDANCSGDPACGYENWVIADDFCLECQCDCDINNDGQCSFLDIARLVQCYQAPALPGCSQADLDCDGDVDFDDIKIIRCLFTNPTDPDACCPKASRGVDRVRWWGSYFEPFVCKGSCECDVNGDTFCDIVDGQIIVDCISDPASHPECSQADLNCDGTVTAGDESVWQCLFQGIAPSTCCADNGTACCAKPNVDSWLVGLHRDIPPVACPPAPTGTTPVDLCGTLLDACAQDPNRLLFQPNGSGFVYELIIGSPAPFVVGDELRLCGYIVPNVKRRCPGTIDVIVTQAVRPCETKHSRPSRLVAQWIFPNDVVRQRLTGKAGWDGHPIYEYTVDLEQGCLDHDFFRKREFDPATSTFFPLRKRTYWLSIQAARGHTVDAACNEVDTGKTADRDFWGWHTTPPGYQHKDDAFMGQLKMSCTDPMKWIYDWQSPLHCSDPRFRDCCDDPTKSIDMAFYLIRTRRVCVGGDLSGQPCDTDADCAVAGTTGGRCVDREKIEWCQPVNPLRPLEPAPGGLPPLPGGDIDEFGETAADVVINVPGLSAGEVHLTGPTVVTRTNPGIDDDDFGATLAAAGAEAAPPMVKVDTEIIAMELVGNDPSLGTVILRVSNIGSSGEDGVRRQGKGQVENLFPPDPDTGFDSFFDVFVEVEVPERGIIAVSEGPVRVEAELFELPPTDVKFQSPPGAVNLVDIENGAVIGSIKSVTHCVPYRGGINIHSDVDWASSPFEDCCEPDDTTDTGCTPTVCPDVDHECIPVEFEVDENGVTTVTDCDCVRVDPPPAECHLVEVAGADPFCEGICPNGLVCDPVPIQEVQADGTIKYRCPCEPDKKQACCLFDGTCIEVTDPADCCAQGGTPQGPNTDCTSVTCPLPDPLDVGMNIDVHMDIAGAIANDFHIEGIVKSTCAPKLKEHIDDLFPNFTYSFTPLGGDHYEFTADWSGQDVQFCQVLHLGLLFEVCCRNVMIDLVGWWTRDGNRIGGGAVAGFTANNDGYWPVVGFEVQDHIIPPFTLIPPQTVRLHNGSGLGSPIPVEIVELQLVSVSPGGALPFDELRVGGQQENLPWQPVLDPSGQPVGPSNPVPLAPGDEIIVLLRPAPGTVAGGDYTSDAPLGPGEYLYVRGLLQFDGNSPTTAAGGQELRWFFDVHEAHNLPEPEACCLEDGTCVELLPQECICAGGRPLGPGTLCDTDGDGAPDACDQTCEPNADETACKRIVCPDDPNGVPQECTQKCVTVDPATGEVRVTACDCQSPDDCHVEVGVTGSGAGGGVAGTGTGDPCIVPDDGSGTVTLPPEGCEYLSPDEVHEIIDGLPAGTTIELGAIHKEFICSKRAQGICSFPILPGVDCDDVGGSLGGGQECAESTLVLDIDGGCPGDLCGYNRNITMPGVVFETHTGPRTPGDPVQSFATDMFRLQGQLSADPDFDVLEIRAGTDFGLPSPGHTTLTELPGGNFVVDSFFDIEYRIDFQGAPGSVLAGLSGSTTGTIRMSTGGGIACKGGCPAGEICVEKKTLLSNGTVEICCDCQAQPECRVNDAGGGCEGVCPNSSQACVPTLMNLPGQTPLVLECGCADPDACHGTIATVPAPHASCEGACPNPGYCARVPVDVDGDGSRDAFRCRCRQKPSPPIAPPGLIKAQRTFGIEHEDIGGAAGGEPLVETAIRVLLKTMYDTSLGCGSRTLRPGLQDLSQYEDEYRWFGPPVEYEDEAVPDMLNFLASELGCCPHFRDWSPSALAAEFGGAGGIPGDPDLSAVHAHGRPVPPCSVFEVQTVESLCPDLSNEACYSEPVEVGTGLWGDVWRPYGDVGFADIGAVVQKFKSIPYDPGPPEMGGPPEVRAMVRGEVQPYDGKVDFIDIGLHVDGFKSIPYRHHGPVEHCNPPDPGCP